MFWCKECTLTRIQTCDLHITRPAISPTLYHYHLQKIPVNIASEYGERTTPSRIFMPCNLSSCRVSYLLKKIECLASNSYLCSQLANIRVTNLQACNWGVKPLSLNVLKAKCLTKKLDLCTLRLKSLDLSSKQYTVSNLLSSRKIASYIKQWLKPEHDMHEQQLWTWISNFLSDRPQPTPGRALRVRLMKQAIFRKILWINDNI